MPDPDVRANTPETVRPGEAPGGSTDFWVANQLAAGEVTMPRHVVNSSVAGTGTGNLRLTYFTARKTEPVTQVRLWCGNTAAAATPTLCRVGIYTVATDGALALAGAIANDTALLATINTAYTRSLTAPFTKQAGQRYAWGLLIVTAAAAPTVYGSATWGSIPAELAEAPRMAGIVTGAQTDLPASVAAAGVGTTGQLHYGVLLP